MTIPVYNIPKDSGIGIDQSAVPTVYASGVSPDTIPWSTAEDIIRDIVREGPFDVHATPMETEDSPLITTSMPGCPYRMTSYTGTAMGTRTLGMVYSFIIHGFWSSSELRSQQDF